MEKRMTAFVFCYWQGTKRKIMYYKLSSEDQHAIEEEKINEFERLAERAEIQNALRKSALNRIYTIENNFQEENSPPENNPHVPLPRTGHVDFLLSSEDMETLKSLIGAEKDTEEQEKLIDVFLSQSGARFSAQNVLSEKEYNTYQQQFLQIVEQRKGKAGGRRKTH